MDQKSIWCEKQNRPSLIVADLAGKTPTPEDVFYALLRRGAFKAFAMRRMLIRLKEHLRARETYLQKLLYVNRTYRRAICADGNYTMPKFHAERQKEIARLKGEITALQQIRTEIDKILKSPRWQAPDNDRVAALWLSRLTAPRST